MRVAIPLPFHIFRNSQIFCFTASNAPSASGRGIVESAKLTHILTNDDREKVTQTKTPTNEIIDDNV